MEVTQVFQPSQPLATFAPAHEVASVDTASEFQRAMMLFMQSQTSINLRMEQALLNQEKHNASQEKHNARMHQQGCRARGLGRGGHGPQQ